MTAAAVPAVRPASAARNPKRYVGMRVATGAGFVYVEDVDSRRALDLRLDLASHSPTGFEWGYGGSGAAQLALALAADATADDKRALRVYQALKWRAVARLPEQGWSILADDVVYAIRQIEIAWGAGR